MTSSCVNNAALHDTFWQSFPMEPTLTDEQSYCDEDEEMNRVSVQQFHFCQGNQRAMMTTPTTENKAGILIEEGSIKKAKDVLLCMSREKGAELEVPEEEIGFSKIIQSTETDEVDDSGSYKSSSTTSSQSTVPTIPPPSEVARQISRYQQSNPKVNKSLRKELSRKKSIGEKSKVSFQSTGQTTITSFETSQSALSSSSGTEGAKQEKEKMPRYLPSHEQSEDPEIVDGTVFGKFQRTCEAIWGPLVFSFWEDYDRKNRPDDETLATYETELSYEEEEYVNVRVAIQATVLGAEYPDALEIPDKDKPQLWGSNFVGVVKSPKGNTFHSRKFPPGSRVASISAWSASINKPYITCNTSQLLAVPPIGGAHLDAPEVAVVVATYLPIFQALHHGNRQQRLTAYTPRSLEGQRVLILAHTKRDNNLKQSLMDAQVQAAVKLALLGGARDVHVTVPNKVTPKKHIFGNDYRVRLLDTPPEDWIPILKSRMDLVLDLTNGSDLDVVTLVQAHRGRYIGFVGEDCATPALHCTEEGPRKKSSWTDGLPCSKGEQSACSSPLPEGKDLSHIISWTASCMNMNNASLFDFYYNCIQNRQLAEHDFDFLLGLLAKRHIRPNVAKILDVDDFPTATSASSTDKTRKAKAMTGAIVCEPWVSQTSDFDNLSVCSSLS